jgi:hypothetical protein
MKTLLKSAVAFSVIAATAATMAGPLNSAFEASPLLVVPTRPDLLNPATNNTNFTSRFLVGTPGSVGTFGNTTQLNGFTGVGGLQIITRSGNFSCTGQLIAPGLVLTAAHCLDAPGLTSINFTQPSNRPGTFPNQVNPGPIQTTYAVSYQIHPGFNPLGSNNGRPENVAGGSDIALIRLVETPPGDIYQIYRGNNELFSNHIKVGAGSSGYGLVGNDSTPTAINSTDRGAGFFDGRKRAGFNQYEAFGREFFDAVTADPLTASGLNVGGPIDGILLYDFDSGDSRNDVFGNLDVYTPGLTGLFFRQQTGVTIGGQNWEINASPGDSGGATFVLDTDGIYKIAGITSFGITGGVLDGVCGGYNQTTGEFLGVNSPVSGRAPLDTSARNNGQCNDSSFGEIGGDARVSSFQAFIDAGIRASSQPNSTFFTILVPEPGSIALLGIGLLGLGIARRRKSA